MEQKKTFVRIVQSVKTDLKTLVRQEKLLAKLADAWLYEPEQRLGQFITNLSGHAHQQLFFLPDEDLEVALDKRLEKISHLLIDPLKCTQSEEHPQWGILKCECDCHDTGKECDKCESI